MIDFQSIQHKPSSDYSLNICFSRRFPYIDGPSFSPHKPLQNVDFSKVGSMQFFFRNCTHILTRTQGKKFEDMFLVKIASKGTSLNILSQAVLGPTHRFAHFFLRGLTYFVAMALESIWVKKPGQENNIKRDVEVSGFATDLFRSNVPVIMQYKLCCSCLSLTSLIWMKDWDNIIKGKHKLWTQSAIAVC